MADESKCWLMVITFLINGTNTCDAFTFWTFNLYFRIRLWPLSAVHVEWPRFISSNPDNESVSGQVLVQQLLWGKSCIFVASKFFFPHSNFKAHKHTEVRWVTLRVGKWDQLRRSRRMWYYGVFHLNLKVAWCFRVCSAGFLNPRWLLHTSQLNDACRCILIVCHSHISHEHRTVHLLSVYCFSDCRY